MYSGHGPARATTLGRMAPPDATALITHFQSDATTRPALVGRRRELGELVRALDATERGDGRSYLVAGDPGIGKSRIADALSGAALERGARVAWGRCWEAGGAPPHWPWVQVVRSLVDGLSGDALAHALGPQAARVRGARARAPATAAPAHPTARGRRRPLRRVGRDRGIPRARRGGHAAGRRP